MKQKIWKDCPVCGAKAALVVKVDHEEMFKTKFYPAAKVEPLAVFFCKRCEAHLLTRKSQDDLNRKLAEHKARHDALTTVVAEVMTLGEAAQNLQMSTNAVQSLMKNGELAYVLLGESRFPKRHAVLKFAKGEDSH